MTAEELQKVARRKVKVGMKVKITQVTQDKHGKDVVKSYGKGIVTAVYRHIFAVDMGNRVECFRFNEFLGRESIKVVKA